MLKFRIVLYSKNDKHTHTYTHNTLDKYICYVKWKHS